MSGRHTGIYESVEKIISNKRLISVFFATSVLTLVAHGINFLNSTFANDRVAFFGNPPYGSESGGKWFAQFYDWIRGYSYLPWLIGILSILYLSFSVYIAVDVLAIEKKLSIWLIAGLYTTNVSVITANLYGLDDYMFALMTGSMSVWVWFLKDSSYQGSFFSLFRKHTWLRMLVSVIFLGLCAAVYGAYVPVAPTLVIMGCVVMLLKGKEVCYVFRRAMEYIATLGAGLAVYYLVLRLFLFFRGTKMQTYMGEDQLVNGISGSDFLHYLKLAYRNTLYNWLGDYSGDSLYVAMPKWLAVAFFVLAIILFALLIYQRREKHKEIKRILLLMCFVFLFPLSSGLIYVMAFGNVHYLMVFSYVYFYIALVKMAEMCYTSDSATENVKRWTQISGRVISCVAVIGLSFFVFYGIRTANLVYNGMEKKYTVSKGIASRLIDRIESVEGYDGTERIVLVGHIMDGDYFRDASGINYWKKVVSGLGVSGESTSFSHIGITPLFLTNIMGFSRPIQLYNADIFTEDQQGYIAEMPWFPADGSVEKIGNTVVVKLSDTGF